MRRTLAPGRITIAELARRAGVSKPVISVVASGNTGGRIGVSEKKRKEIERLIEQCGYVPRKTARDLNALRTNTVGIIFHRLTPYFSLLLEELQEQATGRGLEIMPYLTKGSSDREERYLNMMRDGRVDGVVVAAMLEGSEARYRKYSGAPYHLKMVVIAPRMRGVPTVHFDETEAGRLAARHLLECGRKRLCAFGAPAWTGRFESFLSCAREAGLVAPVVVPGTDDFRNLFEDGRKLAAGLLRGGAVPDGVFAYDDLHAAALLSEAAVRGLRVPEDMAVIGCDNTEICLAMHPTITSIGKNDALAVKCALDKLESLLQGRPLFPLHTTIPVNLAVRGSTVGASI